VSDDGRGLKFGTVAENYDLYRAAPPAEAATLVGDLRGLEVLEVGAGTGKLTRFLLDLGAQVSVIEPDEEMRRVLLRRSPNVTVLLGRAESIPTEAASFDAVFSSSAWHWFIQPDATIEMARVLRDDGTLHVWWNGFSRADPWWVELTALRHGGDDTGARARGWRASLDPDGPFVDVEDFELHWTWLRTIEELVAHFRTYSGAIIRSEADQRVMANEVRTRLTERFGDGVVPVPMTLRGTTSQRRPR
jgi:SAM-dependent methyltransferase